MSILRRNERGWTVEPILRRGTATLVGRQDLLAVPMNMAAARQGVSLDKFELKGRITAEGLMALLNDGQFTTGLLVDRFSPERYAPRADDRTPASSGR